MNDIVERIRSLRYVHVPVASQLFEEACAEIQRLRLTDEEREAIELAAGDYRYHQDAGGRAQHIRQTLLGLLKRLK